MKRLSFSKNLPFLLLYILPVSLFPQSLIPNPQSLIEGIVTDSLSRIPLAFVNIVADNNNNGTNTDIDGKFRISAVSDLQSGTQVQKLTFSYVGYESMTVNINGMNKTPLHIRMKKKNILLKEVIILPGENPAHRIIHKATENRFRNDPEKNRSFSYTSYNKMYFTADTSGFMKKHPLPPQTHKDSSDIRLNKVLERQYLFLMESVSKREYVEPDRNNEKVLATRVSGFQNPAFTMLATEFQSFSFYKDFITISDKNYLNPITKGSADKYLFIMEDTTYNGADTVYIISFQSRKGRNFDGLKGLLYINTNGYAIQNVVAETIDEPGLFVKIQQQYGQQEGGQWFPVQLNTDITFKDMKVNDYPVSGVGRSYLRDININPVIDKKDFSRFEMEVLPEAGRTGEDFWLQYRKDSLTEKEKLTYHVIDSIGKKIHLERKIDIVTALFNGIYPLWVFDFDLNRFLLFNEHESVRLGAGAHTNARLSRFFSLGGFAGYGFKDKRAKYGADIMFNLERRSELKLKFSYMNDLFESGAPQFVFERKPEYAESYRNYFLKRWDAVEQNQVAISFRALQYLQVQVAFNRQQYSSTDNYAYGVQTKNGGMFINKFNFEEAELGLRFAFREKYMLSGKREFSAGTKFPVLWAKISKGFIGVFGDYDYVKADVKFEKTFLIKLFGKETFQLAGGYVSTGLPVAKLYAGKAGYFDFPLASESCFETMRLNEFLASRYVSLFHRHNFGALLLKTKYLHPEIILVNNIGFGQLNNAAAHFNISVRDYPKGYFETGLLVNNLLKLNFTGIGAGIYYRYGGYSLPNLSDNIAAKLSFTLIF